jgi:hypothetical protein
MVDKRWIAEYAAQLVKKSACTVVLLAPHANYSTASRFVHTGGVPNDDRRMIAPAAQMKSCWAYRQLLRS